MRFDSQQEERRAVGRSGFVSRPSKATGAASPRGANSDHTAEEQIGCQSGLLKKTGALLARAKGQWPWGLLGSREMDPGPLRLTFIS